MWLIKCAHSSCVDLLLFSCDCSLMLGDTKLKIFASNDENYYTVWTKQQPHTEPTRAKKWKRRRVLAFPYNSTKPNGLESYGNQKYAVDSTTKTTKIEIYSRRFGVSQIVCVLSQYTWIVFGICFYTDSKMELMTFWHSLSSCCCCRTGFRFKRCSTLTTPRMRSICASVWENGCVVFKRALNWIRLRLTRATISHSDGNPQHILCTYCINQTNL